LKVRGIGLDLFYAGRLGGTVTENAVQFNLHTSL
jgi:hypothetical protein